MAMKKKKLSKELKELRARIETKAGMAAVIDGQQTFFEDLNKVESAVDKKRDEFIISEFKRLGDKINAETGNLHSRVEALEKQDREAILNRMLDQKVDKCDFENFVSLLTNETIAPMQKEIDKSTIEIQHLLELIPNLVEAIKNLENNVEIM